MEKSIAHLDFTSTALACEECPAEATCATVFTCGCRVLFCETHADEFTAFTLNRNSVWGCRAHPSQHIRISHRDRVNIR